MTDAPKTIGLVSNGFGGWRLWTADDADDPAVVAVPYILAADAIEALQAQLAEVRDKALEDAAQTAETRHGVWLGLGADCLVDDDISACSDIATAIRAMNGERG